MKILVTGGAGFIGSHLVDKLINQHHRVFVIDDLSTGKKEYINPGAKFYKKSIQDRKLDVFFKKNKFDVVFHLAAQKNLQFSKDHPIEDADINIIGSLNILNNAKKFEVKKVIFYSTAAIYDPNAKPPNRETDCPCPVTPYGIGKYTFEKYLQNSGINYTVLRLANVYGPRQDSSGEGGVVSIFCENFVKNKRSVINNSGHQTRDFIYVHDVVDASIKSISRGDKMIFNISTNKEVSINSLYDILKVISGSKLIPIRNRKLYEQKRSALDNKLAMKNINWRVNNSLINNLKKTYNWFLKIA